MKKVKCKDIPRTIEMPVYYYEDDDCNKCGNYGSVKENQKLCTDCNGDGLKKHYDFEEMANELENRICNTLNRNILITISEVEED